MKFHHAYRATKIVALAVLLFMTTYYAIKLGPTSEPAILCGTLFIAHIFTTFFIYQELKQKIEGVNDRPTH